MSTEPLPHLVEKTPAEICKAFALSKEAEGLLREELTSREYLDLLMKEKQFLDAIRFWAHALPKREAVWWASLCARMVAKDDAPEAENQALDAAEAWAADPTEDNRRAAMPAAEAAGFANPAGCAAVAAFWSGGSLAPPNVPAVPPGEHLTAHGVASAVMIAAVIAEPERAEEKYRAFVEQGVGVAAGLLRWPEAPVAPASIPPPAPAATARPTQGASRPVIDWG